MKAEFRQQKGYLPPVILVHITPPLENKVREEAAGLVRELNIEPSLVLKG